MMMMTGIIKLGSRSGIICIIIITMTMMIPDHDPSHHLRHMMLMMTGMMIRIMIKNYMYQHPNHPPIHHRHHNDDDDSC